MLDETPARELPERAGNGWRLHRLRDSPFVSFSLDMNYRVLAKVDGDTVFVHRAVKHALADDPRVNRNATAPSPYGVTGAVLQPADLYGVLGALGVRQHDLAPFRAVQTQDDLVRVLSEVAPLVMELALDLYETTGVVSERARYTLYAPDHELQAALEGRFVEWSLYLHPSQSVATLHRRSPSRVPHGCVWLRWYREDGVCVAPHGGTRAAECVRCVGVP